MVRGKTHAGTCKLPRPKGEATQDENNIEGSDVRLYREIQHSRPPTLPRGKARTGAHKPPRPIGEAKKRKMNDQPSIQPRRRRRKDTAENVARSLVEEIMQNVGDTITIRKQPYEGSKVGKFQKIFKRETPEVKKMQFKRKMNQSLIGKTLKGGKSKTGGNVKKITEYLEEISKQSSFVGGGNFGRVGPKESTATTNIASGVCGGEGYTTPGKGVGGVGPIELRANYDMELGDYRG